MSALPGTTCLLSESEDDVPPTPPTRTTRCPSAPPIPVSDPGPVLDRAARAAMTGRPATLCTVCGVPTSDLFTRRATSGKTYCQTCADRMVAAYYARHPEARPDAARLPRDRTGIAYLAERDRYAVRYHAGNGRWQISDTQTRRWCARAAATEADAQALATAMNRAWRVQVDSEKLRFTKR